MALPPSKLPPWARREAARLGIVQQLAALDAGALTQREQEAPQQLLPEVPDRPWERDRAYFEPTDRRVVAPSATRYLPADPFALASKESLRASLLAVARQGRPASRSRTLPAPQPVPQFVSQRDLGPAARPFEPTARFVSAADLERSINPPLTPAIEPPGGLLLDDGGRVVDLLTERQAGIDPALLADPRRYLPPGDGGEDEDDSYSP